MDDAIGGLVGLILLLIGFAVVITMVASWELLKLGWQLLVWLYEAVKPHIIKAWQEWQRSWSEARKPDDIEVVGVAAREEIDHIMAYYRQQVNDILQAEGISPDTPPEVVLLPTQNYKVQEDVYVS
jgi:hypothetical protein